MSPSVPVSMLLNSNPVDAAEHAEKDVSDGLDELERMGLIQPWNRVDIAELLNPESEQKLVDDISDKEIFEAVTNSHKAAQMLEIMGGDDVDEDFNDDKPACKDALAAAITLQKYVADINEPFARKLETILASFGCQTRLEESHALKPTYITDFFTFK